MKRPHQLPRRAWRYPVQGALFEQLVRMSPRQRYIIDQSTLRWEQRHNSGEEKKLHRGELGTIQGVRVIMSGGIHAPVSPLHFTDSPDFGVIFIEAGKP